MYSWKNKHLGISFYLSALFVHFIITLHQKLRTLIFKKKSMLWIEIIYSKKALSGQFHL